MSPQLQEEVSYGEDSQNFAEPDHLQWSCSFGLPFDRNYILTHGVLAATEGHIYRRFYRYDSGYRGMAELLRVEEPSVPRVWPAGVSARERDGTPTCQREKGSVSLSARQSG